MSRPAPFHSLAEKRSWVLHREVARRLTDSPELLDRARARVSAWRLEPASHPYAEDWQRILEGEVTEICGALLDESPRMCTLRQASPFAGALDSPTRWQLLKRPELVNP